MKKYEYVHVECFIDTNLIEFLLGAYVTHQHGCSKVINVLNTRLKDRFAIGLIDADKNKENYIKGFRELAVSEHLTVMKHNERCQYLILVSPAADRFILDSAMIANVSPESFGLPSKLKAFLDITKSDEARKDNRFKSMFKAIGDTGEFGKLRQLLLYLIETGFSAEEDKIKGFAE